MQENTTPPSKDPESERREAIRKLVNKIAETAEQTMARLAAVVHKHDGASRDDVVSVKLDDLAFVMNVIYTIGMAKTVDAVMESLVEARNS